MNLNDEIISNACLALHKTLNFDFISCDQLKMDKNLKTIDSQN